jgi:hypothetical protein
MNENLSVIVRADCNVLRDSRLPSNFSVKTGLRCHLWCNGISHPAEITKCANELQVGESGAIEIMFVALIQEQSQFEIGLVLKLLGGIDIHFADCAVTEVISIQ